VCFALNRVAASRLRLSRKSCIMSGRINAGEALRRDTMGRRVCQICAWGKTLGRFSRAATSAAHASFWNALWKLEILELHISWPRASIHAFGSPSSTRQLFPPRQKSFTRALFRSKGREKLDGSKAGNSTWVNTTTT
jgi:hypothetical protein